MKKIKNKEDLFSRPGEELVVEAFGEWLPSTIYNNKIDWDKWLIK